MIVMGIVLWCLYDRQLGVGWGDGVSAVDIGLDCLVNSHQISSTLIRTIQTALYITN